VKKTNRLLALQETWLTCSVMSEVVSIVSEKAFDYLDAPIRRIGAKDAPVPFNPILENYVLPQVQDIVITIREML